MNEKPLSETITEYYGGLGEVTLTQDDVDNLIQDIQKIEAKRDQLIKKLWESEILLASEIKLYHKERDKVAQVQTDIMNYCRDDCEYFETCVDVGNNCVLVKWKNGDVSASCTKGEVKE